MGGQSAFGGGERQGDEIALQARQHDLRLRVTEARVELERANPFAREDQAGVEHAAKSVT